MRFSDAFRAILAARDYTQVELAKELGITQGGIGSALRKDNPTVGLMNRYLERLGYDVVLVPVGSRLPQGSYKIDGPR